MLEWFKPPFFLETFHPIECGHSDYNMVNINRFVVVVRVSNLAQLLMTLMFPVVFDSRLN
jgi:hypothetical protein